MSLLFDQNLSDRLPRHVKDFGAEEKSDEDVWQLARQAGLAIVTKDADFIFLSLTRGHLPKVIDLARGNSGTAAILELLQRERQAVETFLASPDEALLMF